jgi:transposase-like protein
MSPKKITETEKQEIINLYRQSMATTAALASQFGVSSSTVSRILKSGLDETEYDLLVQQKRSHRFNTVEEEVLNTEVVEREDFNSVSDVETTTEVESPVFPLETIPEESLPPTNMSQELVVREINLNNPDISPPLKVVTKVPSSRGEEESTNEISTLQAMFGEDIEDFGEDIEDFNEDEDWENQGDGEESSTYVLNNYSNVQVVPLSEARLPRTCYLVVDKFAELIVKPLKDFNDLGPIPNGENQRNTLPIFDNHRVAKRFSNHRSQRVIKIPDSRLLLKVMGYLIARGITHILIDGRIYFLG